MSENFPDNQNNIKLIFSPTENHIKEIEEWLIKEYHTTKEGFYCNWRIIKEAAEINDLIILSLNEIAIGFIVWKTISYKSATIEMAELKPDYRKKGLGEILFNKLFNILSDKGIYVIDLHCAPSTSEPFWKKMGFIDFPDSLKEHYTYLEEDKYLFKELKNNTPTDNILFSHETIELWSDEPHKTQKINIPNYCWNLEFIQGTRKLIKPIFQLCYRDWRLRWKVNGETIYDYKAKNFYPEIHFDKYLIIEELPTNT